jgi:hypothetical protein
MSLRGMSWSVLFAVFEVIELDCFLEVLAMRFDATKKVLQDRFLQAYRGLLPSSGRQLCKVSKQRSSRMPQFETLEVRRVFAIDELIGFENNLAVTEGWNTVRNEVQGSIRWVSSDSDRDSPSPSSGSIMTRLNSPYRPGALQADRTYRGIKGDQIFVDGFFDPNATDPLGTARLVMFDALNNNNDVDIWASSSKSTAWTQRSQAVPSTWGTSSSIIDFRLAAVLYQNNRAAPPGDTTAYHNMNFFLDRLIWRHNSVVDGDDAANVISEDSPSGAYTGVRAFVGGFLPYSYSLDDNAGGRFWIDGSGQVMKSDLAIQSGGTYYVRIRASHGTSSVVSGLIPIFVTDVNDPPTLDPLPPITHSEDSARRDIPLSGITDGDSGSQPLLVTAISDNQGLIPNPIVEYTSPNSTGNLKIDTVPNGNGSANIFVTVTDGGLDNDLGTPGDNLSTTRVFNVNVIPVNDAPIARNGASLAAIDEDTANPPGATIATLFAANFNDSADSFPGGSSANAFAGIAVTSYTADASKGQWQYSSGAGWTNLGNVTGQAAATLIPVGHSLRFLPAANFNGAAPTITALLIDDSQGAVSFATGVNISGKGGTTRYSDTTVPLNHTVNPVNDAPVANNVARLDAINEDNAAPPGATAATLFAANFSDAADIVLGGSSANAFAGIAVTLYTADASKGQWQYSSGAGWATLASVTGQAAATLIPVGHSLRFLPAANFNGAAPTITALLIDDSAGPISFLPGVNIAAKGGSTRYSDAAVALNHTVNPVNDAPVATNGASLAAINEDNANPPGATVSTLFSANFSDAADNVPGGSSANAFAGIAVTSYTADATKGQWQYSSGAGWTTLASVTGQSAATLIPVGHSLRFLPVANFNGAAPTITALLIDDSAGPISFLPGVNIAAKGGTTRYSDSTVPLNHTVNPVNDAPDATGVARLAPINEDNANPPGATVTSLFNSNFNDAKDNVAGGSSANSLAGIAVTLYTANAAKGQWQYSSGAGWTTLASVTGQSAATLIPAGHLLRFLPTANFNGPAPTITALLIDDSSGPVSFRTGVNISEKGGITPYSASAVPLNHTVNAINDGPTDITLAPNSIPENAVANATVGTLRTVDADVGNTFTYTFVAGTGDSDNAMFRISGSTLRAAPSFDYETKSSYTIRVKSTDQGGLTVEKALNINVTNVNDVPVFDAPEYEFEVENGSQQRPGLQPNNGQWKPSISRDGRLVSFVSYATNFADVDFDMDVFVKNTRSGAFIEASNTSTGGRSNGDSFNPTLTPDGRYVVFESYASNLVPEDTSAVGDIFIRDLALGTLTRVSTSSFGEEANGRSYSPSISDDGRYVAFRSDATNLVDGDTNNFGDVFVKDLVVGTLTRVSVAENGTQGNNHSFEPIISGDGNYVVFRSYASNLVLGPDNNFEDIYRKNLSTGEIVRVNTSSSGQQGNNAIWYPTISYDGRYVSFPSTANNLVVGDTNNSWDVFVKDMVTGTTVRASTSSTGGQGDGISNYANISGDGRYVSFVSFATNLVPGDTNAKSDIFVKDLVTGQLTRVSTDSAGLQANDASTEAIIGASGVFVAFASTATNLIPNDTNGVADIFVKNIETGETTRAASQNTGVFIGTVSGSDQDAGASLSYSLSGPGADQFVMDPSSGQITLSPTAVMNYDLQPTYSLTATISDGQLSSTVPVTIHVTIGFNRPSDILLSPSSIEENAGDNVVVGNLSSIDPNTGDTFTYTLVEGLGSTDNAAFTIEGNQLRAVNSFDFETKNSYSIRVRSTDQSDLFKEKILTIRVIDVDEGFPLFGTVGNDVFVANYTGDGTTHSWAVTRNGVSVFNGTLPGMLMIDGLGGTDSLDVVGRGVDDSFQLEGGQIFVNSGKLRFPRIESIKVLGGLGNDALVTVTPLASGVAGTFDGGAGSDRFEAASASNVWNITGTDAGQLNSGFSFVATESLVGGAGDDQFVLSALGKTTGPILGGAGSDTLNLSAKTTAHTVNLQANSATSTGGIGGLEVVIGGSAAAIVDVLIGANSDTNWTINAADAGSLTSAATGTVQFRGFESLTGGTSVDNFVISSTGSVSKVLTGGTAAGVVDTLDLSSKTAALDFRVDATASTVPGIVGSYVGLETITGNGVAGSKVTRVNNTTTAWAVNNLGQIVVNTVAYANVSTIVGGIGSDTLTGPSLPSGVATWTVNSANGGTLSIPSVATIAFSGVDGLTGGTGDDAFEILPAGSLSGLLNGGTGTGFNSLSYAQWTTGVTVNLSVATAANSTAVAGVTSNIQMVTGGSGNDTLRGSASKAAVLVGLAGNDTLVGGSQRDLLIGGTGADLLQSANGDDLLVSGRTAYDTNREALKAIHSEWTSARTFAQRTSNIWGNGTGTRNNGAYFLNSNPADAITDTVFADTDADSLTGGLNQDWFFASVNDLTDFVGTGTAPDRLDS